MMEWKKRSANIPNQEIVKVEGQLGVRLPQDYIDWYRQYEGPESDHVWVDVDGEAQDVEGFFNIKDIAKQANKFFDEDESYSKLGIVVPIAVDSIIDKYCFFYPKGSDAHSGIFFASKDTPIDELFEGNEIKKSLFISDTFQGFIDKLYHYDPFEE